MIFIKVHIVNQHIEEFLEIINDEKNSSVGNIFFIYEFN